MNSICAQTTTGSPNRYPKMPLQKQTFPSIQHARSSSGLHRSLFSLHYLLPYTPSIAYNKPHSWWHYTPLVLSLQNNPPTQHQIHQFNDHPGAINPLFFWTSWTHFLTTGPVYTPHSLIEIVSYHTQNTPNFNKLSFYLHFTCNSISYILDNLSKVAWLAYTIPSLPFLYGRKWPF